MVKNDILFYIESFICQWVSKFKGDDNTSILEV